MKNISIIFIMAVLMTQCSVKKKLITNHSLSPNCSCEGKGSYTFVLDAGMGNWLIFYSPVIQKLKLHTKVCWIDRPGYNMFEAPAGKRDAETISKEINAVLVKNNVVDSIIFVGHSMGGLHARMFQYLYPEKVKGLVLLDAAHPNQFDTLPEAFSDLKKQQLEYMDRVIKFAQRDWIKFQKDKIPTFGIPDSLLRRYYEVTISPQYYHTLKKEVFWFDTSLLQVRKINDLGQLPLLVVGSKNSMQQEILPGKLDNYPFEKHNQVWLSLQKDLSNLSNNSMFEISEQNHYLNITDSKFVVNCILKFYYERIDKSF